MYLIFDTETTGLPQNYSAPITDFDNWPRLVQLAWQHHDHTGKLISSGNYIIKPEGFTIPYNSEKIHGISTQKAIDEGHDLETVLHIFRKEIDKTFFLIGHNVSFDEKVMGAEYLRKMIPSAIISKPKIDTKDESTQFCAIPGGRGFKWPTLSELHRKLFNYDFADAHDAAADVEATTRAFLELVLLGVIQVNFPLDARLYEPSASYIVRENYIDLVSPSRLKKKDEDLEEKESVELVPEEEIIEVAQDFAFTHLHCHSKFSVLQATAGVKELVNKAKEQGMPAVALTDLGNMYGAFHLLMLLKMRELNLL